MTLHTKVSLAKSAVRILAGFFLMFAWGFASFVAGSLLIIAELGGIIEEIIPDAYTGTKTSEEVLSVTPENKALRPRRRRVTRGSIQE